MISTQAQAQALQRDWEGDQLVLPDSQAANFTVEQCNQIANISKRTIKAAIIGVPIDEVINIFTKEWTHTRGWAVAGQFVWTEDLPYDIASSGTQDGVKLNNWRVNGDGTNGFHVWVDAIYKTVDKIKIGGDVNQQDALLMLNNRVEQQIIECGENALTTSNPSPRY